MAKISATGIFEIDILAIARILLPALVWSEFGDFFLPSSDLSIQHLIMGFVFYLASFSMLVGWRSRLSTFFFALVLIFLRYYEGEWLHNPDFQHHHLMLAGLATCLLALAPCGRRFSLDAYLAKDSGPGWSPRQAREFNILIRGLLCSVYFFAIISKFSAGSRSGLRIYLRMVRNYFGSTSVPSWAFSAALVITWVVIVLELILAGAVWHPPSARRVLPIAVAFHLALCYFLPVATFSAQMILYWAIVVLT